MTTVDLDKGEYRIIFEMPNPDEAPTTWMEIVFDFIQVLRTQGFIIEEKTVLQKLKGHIDNGGKI
jgi:hypothetical protein